MNCKYIIDTSIVIEDIESRCKLMYLLLEVLNDGYKVYDTVQKCDIEVPKTLKPISGVVNDYISVPYSDCEIKLAQLIEFESISDYN